MTEDEAVRFAESVALACARALRDPIVVLHGSLILGDFVAGRSDVDLLVIAREPPSTAEADDLVAAVSRAPGRVDLRVVTHATASAPMREPQLALGVGLHGDAPEIQRGVHERDLVVELSVCRARGRSLVGAVPADAIAPVPVEWVLEVGDAVLADWERLPFEAEYGELMVFTTCRVWRYAEEGLHCAKSEAAAWALERDSSLTVVVDALASRAQPTRKELDEEGVRDLIARVRAQLRASQVGGVARG